jgi:hypothetical protein
MAFDSARGRTVCFGGLATQEDPNSAFGDTWEWDGTDWIQMADTGPVARSFHTMSYDGIVTSTVITAYYLLLSTKRIERIQWVNELTNCRV